MSWDKHDPHVIEQASHYIHEKLGSPEFPNALTIHWIIVINLIYIVVKLVGFLFR